MAPALRCSFCWRMCSIEPGTSGLCGIRENKQGKLRTIGWGEVVASGVDPIEKKPMYHLLPGAKTFSFALFGCNYTCLFCQNHHITQRESPYWPEQSGASTHTAMSPEELVQLFDRSRTPIMSYTYSDPIVWQDYMLEVAELVHARGKLNCMVTNGSFSTESLNRVLPVIDAFNIDVKGDNQFYRSYCTGALKPVLQAVETIAARKDRILEVTTLIIEGVHTERMMQELAAQLYDAGVQVWHLSRFFPHYRMSSRPQTSEAYLARMLEIARDARISHVYAGNSMLTEWDRTLCPACGTPLVRSHAYSGQAASDVSRTMRDGRCRACNAEIYGLFTT